MSADLIRIDGRELQLGAEPIPTASLREGSEYFSVQYADEQLLIPIIGTWIYIGRGLEESEPDLLYFQDVESYHQGVRYGKSGEENASFHLSRDGKLHHMFDFERALNELLKCALRRCRTSE